MKKTILILLVIVTVLSSCVKNADWEFPDYKYSTVYFPYQTPVRTLVLGEDIYDNSMDNAHKLLIMATMGGVYENKKDITLDVVVDNSLTDKLKFESATGDNVVAMPSNYYSLGKDMKIVIPSGKIMGGIEAQLTDDFFNDPRAVKNTFVIPLRIKSVANADSILSGRSEKTSPDPRKAGDWVTVPKNYVLYAVKYVNPWHGAYLRRGVAEVKGSSGNTALDTTVIYHNAYVEKDQVVNLYTKSMTEDTLTLNAKLKGNVNVPFRMILRFDANGKCTLVNPASASYTLTGNGTFVKKGDMWGNEKRDVLYLKYTVDFGTTTHNLSDTLVLRDRGVKMETFNAFVAN